LYVLYQIVLYSVQAALTQEVVGRRPALKISDWTPTL